MTTSVNAPVGNIPDPTVEPDLAPPAETRRVVSEPIPSEPDHPAPTPITTLTDEERRDFSRLLTCGRRSATITVMGHPVLIQTLTVGDEMRIGLYTQKFSDTQLGFQRAYQVAVCAAGIREVQGSPLWTSLSEVTSEDELFDKSVSALRNFYPVTITQIYQGIMDLEREFAELAIKLGKLPG